MRSRSVQYSALVSGHGVAPSVPLPTARPVSERSSTPAPLRSHPREHFAPTLTADGRSTTSGDARSHTAIVMSWTSVSSGPGTRGFTAERRRPENRFTFKIAARVRLRSADRYFVLAFAPEAWVFFDPLVGPALFCRFIPPVCWLPDDPPSFDFLAMAKTSVSVRADETRRSRTARGVSLMSVILADGWARKF